MNSFLSYPERHNDYTPWKIEAFPEIRTNPVQLSVVGACEQQRMKNWKPGASSKWDSVEQLTTSPANSDSSSQRCWIDCRNSIQFASLADISNTLNEDYQDQCHFWDYITQINDPGTNLIHETKAEWEDSSKSLVEESFRRNPQCSQQTAEFSQDISLENFQKSLKSNKDIQTHDTLRKAKSELSAEIETKTKLETDNAVMLRWTEIAKKVQYRKTKRCPWYAKGKCWLGAQCNYAHHDAELQIPPDLTRTKICVQGLRCRNQHCRFAHKPDELRSTELFFRTKLCKFWSSGLKCPSGDYCRHAHGIDQMRSIPSCDITEKINSSYTPFSINEENQTIMHTTSTSTSFDSRLTSSLEKHQPTQTFIKEEQALHSKTLFTDVQKAHLLNPIGSVIRSHHPISYIPSVSGESCEMQKNFFNDARQTPHSSMERDFAQHVTTDGPISTLFSPKESRFSVTQPHSPENSTRYFTYNKNCIELKDILDLAVASCDPGLLESSAHVLRASMKLKMLRQSQDGIKTYSGEDCVKKVHPIFA